MVPQFELITFPASDLVPVNAVEDLTRVGIPRALLGRPLARESLSTIVNNAAARPLVWFGTFGLASHLCLEPETGQVVCVVGFEPALPHVNGPAWMDTRPAFVNSTLASFVASVRAVTDRFPFYSRSGSDADFDAAARDVARIVASVDPAAIDPDTFWATFVDDVAIGDWATEDVVNRA
jgi:hypothetical protein